MQKDHLIAALKTAFLSFLGAFLFFCLICICYDAELYFSVLARLILSLPFALLGGLLSWYHKRIDQLERQVKWLINRLDKLEGKE